MVLQRFTWIGNKFTISKLEAIESQKERLNKILFFEIIYQRIGYKQNLIFTLKQELQQDESL